MWNNEMEKMDRQAMLALQTERLKKLMKWIAAKSDYYRSRMLSRQINPQSIETFTDLAEIPLTTRGDLAALYPYGLLTAPISNLAWIDCIQQYDLPLLNGYMQEEREKYSEAIARGLTAGGVTRGSIVQVIPECASGGEALSMYDAIAQVGASVFPSAGIHAEKQLHLLRDVNASVLVAAAERLSEISPVFDTMKLNHNQLLASVFYWSESVVPLEQPIIRKIWGQKAYQLYGPVVLASSAVAWECDAHQGLHVQEDLFYPEVVDVETGCVVPDGQEGELVITALTKFAMPVLRYRTGDRVRLERERCRCGRTTCRIVAAF